MNFVVKSSINSQRNEFGSRVIIFNWIYSCHGKKRSMTDM